MLADVMGTGHHAALAARVRPGSTVAVVGDGAVGLRGKLAARRLGAELDRHPGAARGTARRSPASAPPTWCRSAARRPSPRSAS
ncbi:hypothetical protein ACU686_29455 [Yinghuangia aomiensis]